MDPLSFVIGKHLHSIPAYNLEVCVLAEPMLQFRSFLILRNDVLIELRNFLAEVRLQLSIFLVVSHVFHPFSQELRA